MSMLILLVWTTFWQTMINRRVLGVKRRHCPLTPTLTCRKWRRSTPCSSRKMAWNGVCSACLDEHARAETALFCHHVTFQNTFRLASAINYSRSNAFKISSIKPLCSTLPYMAKNRLQLWISRPTEWYNHVITVKRSGLYLKRLFF